MTIGQWVAVVAILAVLALLLKVLFAKPYLLEKQSPERNATLIKEAEQMVTLAKSGDENAGAALLRHIGDPANSDFQGLIVLKEDDVAVVDPSGPQPLEWYIEADDDGVLVPVKRPTQPGMLSG